MAAHEVFVATKSFSVDDDSFSAGDRVSGDCPHIATFPDRFERLDRWEARRAMAESFLDDPDHIEEGTPRGQSTPPAAPALTRALRFLDRSVNRDVLAAEAAERIEDALAADPAGRTAEYLVAVSDEAYSRAFGKLLASGPSDAPLRWTQDEAAAFRRVTEAGAARAMSEGTPSAGGYAVPFTLDPTLTLVGDGSQNPIRTLARVLSVSSNEWKGIKTQGITAHYTAEATEASDDSPVLEQPAIFAEKGQAWIPWSIEVGQDWTTLQAELTRALADAKDQLESEKFLIGRGHAANEPEGLLVGGTVTVQTAGATTLAVGDVYSLLQAPPPRFQPRASVLASSVIFDRVYRLVGTNSTEPPLMPDRAGPLLGRPKAEWSSMGTALSSGASIIVAGDVNAAFAVIDRIGMAIELVPHVFGQNHRPTGERGLYAHWRSGSGVTAAEAIRVLVVK